MRAIAAAVSIALIGCGAAKPPHSLEQFEMLISSDGADQAQGVAPEAWSEGLRYLDLARNAAKDRDCERSDRFAQLGLIRIKTAFADAVRAEAKRRIDAADGRMRKVESEMSRVDSLVKGVE